MKKSNFNFPIRLFSPLLFLLLLCCISPDSSLKAQSVQLTGDEKLQMDVLKRESISRINQIGEIVGRTLGKSLIPVKYAVLTFDGSGGMNAQIGDPELDDIALGFYCDPPGVCTPDPCEEANGKGRSLSGSDRVRMQRLKKEMLIRSNEIAGIVGKKLGKNLTPVKRIAFSFESTTGGMNVEIGDPDLDDILLGYYCDPPGICTADPCE